MLQFTKQEQFVLFIVVVLLLTGLAAKFYRSKHSVAAAVQSQSLK